MAKDLVKVKVEPLVPLRANASKETRLQWVRSLGTEAIAKANATMSVWYWYLGRELLQLKADLSPTEYKEAMAEIGVHRNTASKARRIYQQWKNVKELEQLRLSIDAAASGQTYHEREEGIEGADIPDTDEAEEEDPDAFDPDSYDPNEDEEPVNISKPVNRKVANKRATRTIHGEKRPDKPRVWVAREGKGGWWDAIQVKNVDFKKHAPCESKEEAEQLAHEKNFAKRIAEGASPDQLYEVSEYGITKNSLPHKHDYTFDEAKAQLVRIYATAALDAIERLAVATAKDYEAVHAICDSYTASPFEYGVDAVEVAKQAVQELTQAIEALDIELYPFTEPDQRPRNEPVVKPVSMEGRTPIRLGRNKK